MELVHICSPVRSLDKNAAPSISGEMYFHPEKKVWYGGDNEGETTVIIRFCPFCGLDLSTLSAQQARQADATSAALSQITPGTLEQN